MQAPNTAAQPTARRRAIRLSLAILLTCALALALPLLLSVAGFQPISENLAAIMAAVAAVMTAACVAISAVAARRERAEAMAVICINPLEVTHLTQHSLNIDGEAADALTDGLPD